MSLEEIRNERLKKLNLLKESGFNPYPISTRRNLSVEKALKNFELLFEKKTVVMAGRVYSIRGQGGLLFLHFDDGTGRFQGAIKKDEVGEKSFSLFTDTVDVGDFIEIGGILSKTMRGEKTLFVREWKMLAKSLRPLPEKWHGLKDNEERFRRRYLDLVSNEESVLRFKVRTKVVSAIRSFLDKNGYMEVETPILQSMYGGASAEPFTTHHDALDSDLFLRISDELYLKRLLIGGLPKVYELSKNFRNEGIDVTHYPEFTMLEFYEAYSDAKKQMAFTEKLLKVLVKTVSGGTSISLGGGTIDFSKRFAREKYADVLARHALIPHILKLSFEEVREKAKALGANIEAGDNKAKILDKIFKRACRPKLIEPTFVTDYPAENLPLAKKNPKDESKVDAFQLYAGGIELVKAFSELNDPLDQEKRLRAQEEFRKGGDEEAQPLDLDFIEAMEYGMPPAGGVGIGIDRLVMFLTDTANIKETILFPTMRPRNQ
ncbi:MAG: lysine--tRNA ligase [Parcubacteria group bacterium]|nr:lysine--tRNA ligase [Parcubacteria group bacterium]